jgi:hypothetical protein
VARQDQALSAALDRVELDLALLQLAHQILEQPSNGWENKWACIHSEPSQ